MKRLLALISTGVLVAVGLVSLPATPAAADTPIVVGSPTFAEAADYRSDKWADAWDFSEPSDGISISNWFSFNASTSVSDGQLRATATAGGWIELLQTRSYPPAADDAYAKPLSPSTYSRISFRLWSERRTLVMLSWHDCFAGVGCEDRRELEVFKGWNTYDIDPTALPRCCGSSNTHPWNRSVGGIRLGIAENNEYRLDWFRVYKPSGNVTVNVGAESVNEVWWDADLDPSNNLDSPSAGKLANAVGANGTVTFNASAYPPGTYYFYTVKGVVKSAYSTPVTIVPKPRPVILDPDAAGGDDWASVVRRDPWDFTQPGDIIAWGDTGPGDPQPKFSGGILSVATSAGSVHPGETYIELAVPGAIDAALYHRLTVQSVLHGPFDLGMGPGGGSMTRLLWKDAPHTLWHDGEDMVPVTERWNTYTMNLHTDPRIDMEDEFSHDRAGFGVPGREYIYALRWDPHEDPGGRGYEIDYIKLARNDRGKPNFAVRFEDRAWVPGTTVDIYLDADGAGFGDATKIESDIAVGPGVNVYNLRTSKLASGSRYIVLVMKSPAGTSTTSYSTGPVDMGTWNGFIDVPSGHQFRPQIDWLTAELIASGFEDNSYRPTATVSRQAAASFLWKYAGSPPPTGPSFPDVGPGHLFYDPIRWMVQESIASGFTDGTFGPTTAVSRQALASFLYKLAGSPPVSGLSGFNDVPDDYPFGPAITWVSQAGVADGYDDGSFRPGAPISRQALASMLAKYDAMYAAPPA